MRYDLSVRCLCSSQIPVKLPACTSLCHLERAKRVERSHLPHRGRSLRLKALRPSACRKPFQASGIICRESRDLSPSLSSLVATSPTSGNAARTGRPHSVLWGRCVRARARYRRVARADPFRNALQSLSSRATLAEKGRSAQRVRAAGRCLRLQSGPSPKRQDKWCKGVISAGAALWRRRTRLHRAT